MSPPLAPERRIADDIARKAAIISPLVVIVAGLIRGIDGAVSAGIALALVAVNFVVSSIIMTWFARGGPGAVAGAVLFGTAFRLGVLFVAILGLSKVAWIDVPTLVIVIAFSHLGLLVWESRSLGFNSNYLTFPGNKE